ncbi:hypothetical protein PAPYR_8157 [Paratrimastix pyriformis]|uniref:F-box domain-containing protein n=1 Tax=Paratrimastix pyriformis TaxID=342808 RepID=A0ABQ8UGZ2_9EUKA|nr:hypothetical protein PAPYR_8157 [Paratrimastix pyriformis]
MDTLPSELVLAILELCPDDYVHLARTCRAWKTILDSEEYWAHQSMLLRAEPPPVMLQHPGFSWKLYFRHSVTFDRTVTTLRDKDLRYSPSGRSCECLAMHTDWGNLVLNRRFKKATVWLLFAGQMDVDKDRWRAGFMLEPNPYHVAGQTRSGWGFCNFDQSFGHGGHWGSRRGPPFPDGVPLGLGFVEGLFFAQTGFRGYQESFTHAPLKQPASFVLSLKTPVLATVLGVTFPCAPELPSWMAGGCEDAVVGGSIPRVVPTD